MCVEFKMKFYATQSIEAHKIKLSANRNMVQQFLSKKKTCSFVLQRKNCELGMTALTELNVFFFTCNLKNENKVNQSIQNIILWLILTLHFSGSAIAQACGYSTFLPVTISYIYFSKLYKETWHGIISLVLITFPDNRYQ